MVNTMHKFTRRITHHIIGGDERRPWSLADKNMVVEWHGEYIAGNEGMLVEGETAREYNNVVQPTVCTSPTVTIAYQTNDGNNGYREGQEKTSEQDVGNIARKRHR